MNSDGIGRKGAELATDPLFELQLRIAQRADRLLEERSLSALQCWLQAEAEILPREFSPCAESIR